MCGGCIYITAVLNARVTRHPEKRVTYMFADNDLIETLYRFLFSLLPFPFLFHPLSATPHMRKAVGEETAKTDA